MKLSLVSNEMVSHFYYTIILLFFNECMRPRKTWRSQVEKESKSVGLKKEDAKNRARWRVGVREIAGRVG